MKFALHGIQILISAIMVIAGPPIMVLNILCGLVSAVWLAILGDWGAIVVGIVLYVFSTSWIRIAIVPAGICYLPSRWFAKKGHGYWELVFIVLGSVGIAILLAFWCLIIFLLFDSGSRGHVLIPHLIWSYGIALFPWVTIAQKDEVHGSLSERASYFAIFSAAAAYVVVIVLTILRPIEYRQTVFIFFGVMLGCIFILATLSTVLVVARRSPTIARIVFQDGDSGNI